MLPYCSTCKFSFVQIPAEKPTFFNTHKSQMNHNKSLLSRSHHRKLASPKLFSANTLLLQTGQPNGDSSVFSKLIDLQKCRIKNILLSQGFSRTFISGNKNFCVISTSRNFLAQVTKLNYSVFVQRMQSLGFNRSPLTMLLAEVHMFCWNTLAGSLLKYHESLLF